MSKSLGNVLLVRDLLQQAPGEAIRLALLAAHYRAPLDWSAEGLDQAKRRLDGLYQTLRALQDVPVGEDRAAAVPAAFMEALQDDLNTPTALAELAHLSRAANSARSDTERRRLKTELLASGEVLGLLQQDPESWFAGERANIDRDEVQRLVDQREMARKSGDYHRADEIRDRLEDMGISLEDGPDGTRWRFMD